MKPFFVPFFAVLTVVVLTNQYVYSQVRYPSVPMSEVVTYYVSPIYEKQSYPVSSRVVFPLQERVYTNERYTIGQIVPSETYTVEKPTKKSIALPPSLERLAPLLPEQDYAEADSSETILGQSRTVDDLSEILNSPPPPAQGAVEEGTIDSKLTGSSETSEPDEVIPEKSSAQSGLAAKVPTSSDPLGYAVLLTATVITTVGLVYMAFVAYDYRQRWMQSLTMQNDRYLGGGAFDMEMEDMYGTYGSGSVAFPEGFGLTRRSI